MFLNELRTLPNSLVARLDPIRVQEYVRTSGWTYEPEASGRSAVYHRPEAAVEQILIPLSHDLRDFTPRMAEVVAYVAAWEKRPALELLHDLLLPPADILRFAETGSVADAGNVPPEHGLDLLTGARNILRASACSVLRPEPFHPRLDLPEAEQFLRYCRLGPVELGSYVIAVACPLDTGPTAPRVPGAPFGRRVTTLLMRSVSCLAHAIELGAPESALQPGNGELRISANLCEALLDMTPEGDGSALTISASWARHLPPSEGAPPARVRLPREAFDRLEPLIEKLRRAGAPRREIWFGFVDTLNGRPTADNGLAGQVILRLVDPEQETSRASVELTPEQYRLAWEAHGRNQPVILRGVLQRGGRLHRLDDVSDFAPLSREADGR